MDNRTIVSLITIILSIMLLIFAFRLAVMGIGYFIGFFIPLILIVLLLGVYPSILTDLTKTTFLSLINYINFYA